MRNDSILHTGASSASYQLEKRLKRNEKKLNIKRELIPKADVIFEVIDKHEAKLGEKLYLLTDENSDDNKVKDTLNAIRMHREFIQQLKAQLDHALRAKPIEEKKND